MQALFSTMTEKVQQPMTDFRRLCLEAEKNNELDVALVDMDDGQQPDDPYAGEIKRLEAEYGPFANGMSITVQLKDLLIILLVLLLRLLPTNLQYFLICMDNLVFDWYICVRYNNTMLFARQNNSILLF
jgi:hypothetical protein